MRLAILADIHADLGALRDALAHAKRLGCAQVLCAGDLVGYGESPEAVVGLCGARGISCVRGNHDRWAANPGGSALPMPPLSGEALHYLGALPRVWQKVVEGVRLAMCHGTPESDMDVIHPGKLTSTDVRALLQASAADVLIHGHSHAPSWVRDVGGGMLVNPGALLRDRGPGAPAPVRFDGRQRVFVTDDRAFPATFGVLALPDRIFTVHRADDGIELPVPTVNTGVV